MCVSFEGSPPEIDKALNFVNYVFTTVFVVEAVLKLIAFGATYF
jgi:hypothetical protein